jgi:hypothetical protein
VFKRGRTELRGTFFALPFQLSKGAAEQHAPGDRAEAPIGHEAVRLLEYLDAHLGATAKIS